ncbi:hypothetical protein MKY19_22430 [Paenibacillus sp. FSL R5-0744]|uniref:hypothetical protein n=1 Tax=Paenibacillus sp. FSL R5-0744 TaxID=2921656 RepID=UPI0030DDB34A
MVILSTGPISNNLIGGVRPSSFVTIKIDNRNEADYSTILIEGFYLNGTRTIYVQELMLVLTNTVITRNYSVEFDAFEFVFTIIGPAENETQVSLWGKDESRELVAAHRILSDELLGSVEVVTGATGATGVTGVTGATGTTGATGVTGPVPVSAFRVNKDDQQQLIGDTVITFQTVEFDLNGEFNPLTSTFTPIQNGIYLIIGSIFFVNNLVADFKASVRIEKNGVVVAEDSEVSLGSFGNAIYVEVSSILLLQAGDQVRIRANALSGTIFAQGGIGLPERCHFEAARFPSPT